MKFEKAWLNYKREEGILDGEFLLAVRGNFKHPILLNAAKEIQMAAKGLFDQELRFLEEEEVLLCGIDLIVDRIEEAQESVVCEEAYEISEYNGILRVISPSEKGVLYGVFSLLRQLRIGKRLKNIAVKEVPSNPLRMINHWDNMDGSIERGYSGNSFFFEKNRILVNDRTRMYARLVASVGINAVVINNVNVKDAATYLISERYYDELHELSELFYEYGISLFLSLNFAAPMEMGELNSADPLDENVIAWWHEKMQEVYFNVPKLGGFLVKADSEGRPGPFTYGRNHAEGANMLAKEIAPYKGIIIWRCFVYNCQQDWRDRVTDRARAGYDHFMSLDGMFAENVILQIKNGPMDFQVREPISPLLGGLKHTNQILEVQTAQEYTGQQRHVCYLIPMFKEVLEFKTYCQEDRDRVADIVSGRAFGQERCGMATVINTGNDENWTGHDLAAANFYGFGRLAFQSEVSAKELAIEWTTLNFGRNEKVVNAIVGILMNSWPTYEKYTSPLGIGWMVQPNHHYGPSVDGYEYSRWGTYHRADHFGIGVDRTKNGTGYAGQYHEENARMYEQVETCPEELLLFFHHVPYTYRLKCGKTLIQHIYDTHFEGVLEVEEMLKVWKSLEKEVDSIVYQRVLKRMEHQLEHSKEWRDQINSYFYRKSATEDELHRLIY
ncbi:MAG: alpha-glucuronidase [Vallitaleaceae bacterium]|nr:alpha-glucuronidase [Vallitaleaceae bacterium]